jgi:hypothetical protein
MAPARRRNEPAPAPPTIVADIVLTAAFACWAMAVIVAVTGFTGDAFGEAGRRIALMFAGSLVIAGGFLWLLGATLLRDARWSLESYAMPFAVGAIIGAVELVLLFNLWAFWLWAPPLLVIFALRPVRRALFRPFYRGDRR